MIARILGEGQFRLNDDLIDRLNDLDDDLIDEIEEGEGGDYAAVLVKMLDLIRSEGRPLADDELVQSDIILPPDHASLAELRDLVTGEGLIPG